MNRGFNARQVLKQSLPWLALLCSVLIYALHFFVGGGRTKLITDSQAYLVLAQGEHMGAPYHSRILGPFVASLVASSLGVSNRAAFQLLTPIALLASLLLLRKILSKRGGNIGWQAAVLLALGSALAVTFGYTPVMVDPLLLLLACLTIMTLSNRQYTAAIVLGIIAALTKEYGLLLGFVSSVVAYRRGHRKLALIGALLPLVVFLVATLPRSGSSRVGEQAWTSFFYAMFGYHIQVFRFRGASEYPKLLYMWIWSVIWPVLVIGAGVVIARLRNRGRLGDDEAGYAVMVCALPILLLGDWGRVLLVVVPFGCAVATSHRLAGQRRFAVLLAVGGLATALARPFHSEALPPYAFTILMTLISVVASSLLGIMILRFGAAKPSPQLDQEMSGSSAGVVASTVLKGLIY